MKILVMVTGLGMGGAERQVCDLVDGFSAQGHSVMLISLTGDSVNYPRNANVQVIELKMSKSILGFLKAYTQVRDLIHIFKPQVVHSHMVHANLFARLLRLSVKIPYLISSAHSKNEGGSVRMLAYRLTDPLCNLTTNVSQEAVDSFLAKKAAPLGRIQAIYNGIDTKKFIYSESSRIEIRNELGLPLETPLILAVGRLTEAKDYPNLLQAISLLPPEYNSVHLAIIGLGEEEDYLKKMVISLRLEGRVYFLGLKRNVHEWMSVADLYVMSSAWEGMPLVLLEAMSCKNTVVATDCGGVKEVVGNTGFLVKPKEPKLLSDMIVQALSLSSEERLHFGNSARQRVVDNYSINTICAKWLSLYQGNDFKQS